MGRKVRHEVHIPQTSVRDPSQESVHRHQQRGASFSEPDFGETRLAFLNVFGERRECLLIVFRLTLRGRMRDNMSIRRECNVDFVEAAPSGTIY